LVRQARQPWAGARSDKKEIEYFEYRSGYQDVWFKKNTTRTIHDEIIKALPACVT